MSAPTSPPNGKPEASVATPPGDGARRPIPPDDGGTPRRDDVRSADAADFTFPVRVYYEDTDAGGVVYHANYLKFMERARSEWLRSLGFEQDALRREHGVLFAVTRVRIEFLKPARFNDLLVVGVTMRRLGRVSLDVAQAVRDVAGALVCAGEVRVACLDGTTLRPRPLPEPLLRGLPP
jgi:acyl-CoA thioester hydrolase